MNRGQPVNGLNFNDDLAVDDYSLEQTCEKTASPLLPFLAFSCLFGPLDIDTKVISH
jgi:hypothetical protein